jgi:hypothetical protein
MFKKANFDWSFPLSETEIPLCSENIYMLHPQDLSGIYFLYSTETKPRLLYVGRTLNVGHRLLAHKRKIPHGEMFFLPTPSHVAQKLERAFIESLRPPRNLVGKGGSSLDGLICKELAARFHAQIRRLRRAHLRQVQEKPLCTRPSPKIRTGL